ncbi:MAG: nucleoside deaminase [Saprospiraceae bacterium]|nr:nucleoside deaminase [Saprospiraceae bacterium]
MILADYFMKEALKEAEKAFEEGEVPVGAVIVSGNTIIAKAHNQVEILTDPTAHAEMLAITSATNYLGAKYLEDCTLYVTLEPCPMCASALNLAKIGKIVYAAEDEKNGFMRYGTKMLHPKTKIDFGLMNTESISLMQNFFRDKR